jgi:peptidoglycan-N-acetylglucosamine deacetylase
MKILRENWSRLFIGSFILSFAFCLLGTSQSGAAVKNGANSSANGNSYAAQSGLSTESDKFWQNAKEKVYQSVPALLAQHKAELAQGLKFGKLMRGNSLKKQIAITFDDGPHPKYTPQLLAILRQHQVKATFFVVGEMAEKYPELIQAEIADGHLVGNHTYHHVNLTKIPVGYVATEIQACGDVVKNITGRFPHTFRPPGGDYNPQVAEIVDALGYTMILWTDDPGDYASPGEKVIEKRLLPRLNNGGIILIHDGVQQTVDLLPWLLQELKAKGYQCVTIEEMLRDKSRGK